VINFGVEIEVVLLQVESFEIVDFALDFSCVKNCLPQTVSVEFAL
jgi:hypothetical protein